MKIFAFVAYSILIVLISVLAYLNIIPTKEITIPYYDLIGHFVLYGVWGYLFATVIHQPIFHIKSFFLPWGIVIVSIITIVEECLQSLSPVRTTSFSDLLFSMLGITVATLIFNKRRMVKEVK